jgi:(2Fe-2S) ferredoxin
VNQNSGSNYSAPARISVLVCQHLTCRKQGAAKVLAAFRELKTPNVVYEGCGCLGNCGNGPMVFILPARIWYYLVQPHDVPKIAAVLINSMNIILHITQRQAWATAKNIGLRFRRLHSLLDSRPSDRLGKSLFQKSNGSSHPQN